MSHFPVRERLEKQFIVGPHAPRPAGAVTRLAAVQAQDYYGSLWAVGLRTAGAAEADVEAAIVDRSIVRSWPLRGTLHFVAAEDIRWMLALLAPRVIAGTGRRNRELALTDADFALARRTLETALAGGSCLTRPQVYERFQLAGVSPAGQRGIHLLWRAAVEAVICFGPRQRKQQTFVLLDEWLPSEARLEREEALGRLATRYFAGHGPATVDDFIWWSGLTAGDARKAVELARKSLVSDEVEGMTYWSAELPTAAPVLAGGAERRGRPEPSTSFEVAADEKSPRPPGGDSLEGHEGAANLLPAFDEYLVGYRNRSAALGPIHRRRINEGGGILKPVVLIGGMVVATWGRQLRKDRVTVTVTRLLDSRTGDVDAIEAAAARYAAFLGLPAEVVFV